jgi:transcriptional regulator with XRE-family HTH domain
MVKNLRTIRKNRGLSQRQLASRAGITPYMVSYLENGQRVGSVRTVLKLARALDVSVEDLCTEPVPRVSHAT